jgi:hypothetical protein
VQISRNPAESGHRDYSRLSWAIAGFKIGPGVVFRRVKRPSDHELNVVRFCRAVIIWLEIGRRSSAIVRFAGRRETAHSLAVRKKFHRSLRSEQPQLSAPEMDACFDDSRIERHVWSLRHGRRVVTRTGAEQREWCASVRPADGLGKQLHGSPVWLPISAQKPSRKRWQRQAKQQDNPGQYAINQVYVGCDAQSALLNLKPCGSVYRGSQPASVSRTITSIILRTQYRIDVGIAPWASTFSRGD